MCNLIFSEDRKCVIGVVDKYVQHVILPEGVEAIGNDAFKNCYQLLSVDIPQSVVRIDRGAFYNCNSLLEIEIPPSVNSIGQLAFSGCDSLRTIDLPNSITTIKAGAFSGCHSLKSLIIPKGIKSIESYCFSECYSLEYVRIPETVNRIGDGAFYSSGLKDLVIPHSVRSIGNNAFRQCMWLDFVEIPYGVLSIGKGAFANCQGMKAVLFPQSLKCIGEGAFSGSSIMKFYIPQNVEAIKSNALNSIFLEEIIVDAQNNYFKSMDGVLYNKNGDTLVLVPCRIDKQFFTIRKEVRYIGVDAFSLTWIPEIEIPDSVRVINSRSFASRNIKAIYSNIRDLDKVQVAQDAFSETELDQFGFGVDYSSCVLYVPSGTRWAYRHHPVFGKFASIEIEE